MLGLGNGTFNGSPSLVLTFGLGVGEASAATLVGAWYDVIEIQAEYYA
jgi:hypothetical protein